MTSNKKPVPYSASSGSPKQPTKIEKCQACSLGRKNKAVLMDHLKKLNLNEFACGLCSLLFPDSSVLADHLQCVHMAKDSWNCHFCSEQCFCFLDLIKHVQTHTLGQEKNKLKNKLERKSDGCKATKICSEISVKFVNGVKIFSCTICQRQVFGESSLRKHLLTHDTHDFAPCHICSLLLSKKAMTRLKSQKHLDRNTVGMPQCKQCLKTFTGRDSLKRHLQSHQEAKNMHCTICAGRFPSRHYLMKHIRSIHTCAVCEHVFPTISYKEKHIQNAHEGQLVCKVCSKKFSNERQLETHFQTHAVKIKKCWPSIEPKMSRCHICSILLSRRNMYLHATQKHYDRNTGLPECKQCSKTFSSIDSLKDHLETHQEAKSVSCTICARRFPSKYFLVKHTQSIHTCALCEQVFPTVDHKDQHIQNAHKGQVVDSKNFSGECQLETHFQTHVVKKEICCPSLEPVNNMTEEINGTVNSNTSETGKEVFKDMKVETDCDSKEPENKSQRNKNDSPVELADQALCASQKIKVEKDNNPIKLPDRALYAIQEIEIEMNFNPFENENNYLCSVEEEQSETDDSEESDNEALNEIQEIKIKEEKEYNVDLC